MEYLLALEYKYSLTNAQNISQLRVRDNIFAYIKKIKGLYKDVCLDDDLEFLVVKAVASNINQPLILGGACFYYTTSLFHLEKLEPL